MCLAAGASQLRSRKSKCTTAPQTPTPGKDAAILQSTLIYAGLLPLIASAAVTFALRWPQVSPRAIWASAVAGGFIVGLVGLKSEQGFVLALRSFAQPQEAAYWLPILVLLALGANLVLIAAPRSGRWFASALAGFLTIAATLRLLSGYAGFTYNHWSAAGKLGCLALFTGTLGLLWTLLASKGDIAQKSPERQPLLVLVAVGMAVVLTLSGVFVYGEYCGAIAASITGAALACTVLGATGSPGLSLSKPASASLGPSTNSVGVFDDFDAVSGAAGVLTFSLGGLIILGYFFASLTATNMVLLFISLAAAGTAFPAVLNNRPAWQRLATRSVLCLVPLAIAIASVAAKHLALGQ